MYWICARLFWLNKIYEKQGFKGLDFSISWKQQNNEWLYDYFISVHPSKVLNTSQLRGINQKYKYILEKSN